MSNSIEQLSEAGKLGAASLNRDPEKKRAATLKAAATRKAKNPNVFREMGYLGGITPKKKKVRNESI